MLAEFLSALRDPTETAAVLTTVACVVLAARSSIWNFPLGIVSCALYAVVFVRARLYSDAGLQVAFVALSVWGWYEWLRRGPAATAAPVRPVARTGRGEALALAAGAVAYALGAGYLLGRHTDAALPYWDSATTAVSLAAQVLLSRRKIENWPLWVAVDAAYVGMYWHRQLLLTSGLYAVLLGLAAYGWWQWRRELVQTEEKFVSAGK